MSRIRLKLAAAGLTAFLALGALAGCTASAGSSAGSAAGTSGRSLTSGGAQVDFQSASGRMPVATTAADHAIVTSGTLRLAAKDPVAVADRIARLTGTAGGTVSTSTERPAEDDDDSARLTVRIPAAAFARTLRAIEAEGDVRDVTVRSTDVTATVTDYGVRIANLRTSIARLQTLLSKATSSSALVEIESALTDRQGKLEQLLAQQRDLADQVALSTLDVTVQVPAAAPRKGPQDFAAGLVTGLAGLASTAAALAVGLGLALPWLVVLAAIGAVAAVVVRAVRRRPTSA